MNYRHAFHAGNHADVLKHVVLMMLVAHLKKKPAPFFYLDTHAGGGGYDLSLGESQRSGEYKTGIGRLLEFPETALPPEVLDYVRLVRDCAGPGRSAITAYPGSPAIVARLRRPGDRLVLVDAHAPEARALRNLLGRQKLVSIVEGDGYAAVKAHTPPRENRGLVLIDPPYESDARVRRRARGARNRVRALADRHLLRLVPAHRARGTAAFPAQPRALGHPQGARLHAERDAGGHAGRPARIGSRHRQSALAARRAARASCCPTCTACSCPTAAAAPAWSGGRRSSG